MMMLALHRVLLIEDNPADIELIRIAFEEANVGVALQECRDGQGALELVKRLSAGERSELPELILLDLNLPRASGRDVLAEIRRHPGLGHVPVVILTSSSRPSDWSSCLSLGIAAYELKPRGLDEFSELMNRLRVYLPG